MFVTEGGNRKSVPPEGTHEECLGTYVGAYTFATSADIRVYRDWFPKLQNKCLKCKKPLW